MLFVAIYDVKGHQDVGWRDLMLRPEIADLEDYGHDSRRIDAEQIRGVFDLRFTASLAELKGRLILERPPGGRGYTRWAGRHSFPVAAILEESALASGMPAWDEIVLDWGQLAVLPTSWSVRLAEWRGIYLITDMSDAAQYVGAAYGTDNLLGRWRSYAATGDGGNRDLRGHNPANFRFSILQRVSSDMDAEDVVAEEGSWKTRLLTRELGLNAN